MNRIAAKVAVIIPVWNDAEALDAPCPNSKRLTVLSWLNLK